MELPTKLPKTTTTQRTGIPVWFDTFITAVIMLQAAALALETYPAFSQLSPLFEGIHFSVISIFVGEAALKITVLGPKRYFKDGWNVFDFAIAVLSLVPVTGGLSTAVRLVMLLRVTRLTTRSRELRLLVSTLVRSIPSILNILLLLGILFFIYGIAGHYLFGEIDPERWGTLNDSLLTLFKIITLEGWGTIMLSVLSSLPLAWVYFVSFIMIGTFIVINLFVAVIIRKTEEAHKQNEMESGAVPTQLEIMHEIKEIKRIIEDLEKRLDTAKEMKEKQKQ